MSPGHKIRDSHVKKWVGWYVEREALRKIEIKPFIQLVIESVLKLCSGCWMLFDDGESGLNDVS